MEDDLPMIDLRPMSSIDSEFTARSGGRTISGISTVSRRTSIQS
jgi:hypothetical protein